MNLPRNFLAGAILALLPLTGALACNTAAWNGGATGAPLADDPDTFGPNGPTEAGAVKRYSGACGLQAAATGNSFVTDNSPAADGDDDTPYRARFYAYTGHSASAKVFRATDQDGGQGNELISVTYNPGSPGNFTIAGPGATANSTLNFPNILADRWYSIELKYQDGQPLDAFILGAGAPTEQTQSTPAIAGAGVESISLGHIGTGTGTGSITVDEFDSSRGATRIGTLLRGDAITAAGQEAAPTCDANDVSAVISEFFMLANPDARFALAPGQSDCNEDGAIDANDISCLITRFFAQVNNGQPCGGI